MENSYKFFKNEQCEYYPCHKGIATLNCLFCYCPFYAWEECPGNNTYIDRPDGRKIKNCTDCIFPHIPSNQGQVMEYLKMGKEAFYRTKHPIPRKFYGIGVGPGNAALLTKQAEEIIKGVDVLMLPAKDRESCRAYKIAEKAIPEIKGKECIFHPFPMSMKEPALTDFHQEVAAAVEQCLQNGKSVGFLSIGDVAIYSTFAYVEQLVSEAGFETEYVSGIPSFCAASARLNTYLTLGAEEMHIIPGSADLNQAFALSGTLVFMKSGKRLLELKERLLLWEQENAIQVLAVSNCGMEDELISVGAANITEENGYLTIVIVRRD